MILYHTSLGLTAARTPLDAPTPLSEIEWDDVFRSKISVGEVQRLFDLALQSSSANEKPLGELRAPIDTQEVWGAGVTYLRSRTARMKESESSGGSLFYDKVYSAHRPELFFKATPHRVVGQGGSMTLRKDSTWIVPEPELALAFTNRGELIGYTIANDLSSRDIEGDNPLYLPQAKVFDRCAALGPGLLLAAAYPPSSTEVHLAIRRNGNELFTGQTSISQMKQTFENLREHLFRHNSFPSGCYLMTGTGIVPGNEFSLEPNDEVSITIPEIGTLTNRME